MNWAAILADESRNSTLLRLDELSRRYYIQEAVVRNALRRAEARGLVEHVSAKVYINRLNQHFSACDLVNVLRPESYISLESGLIERGVITQNPAILTCVTTGYPKTFSSPSVRIMYRRIAKSLYWGFEERATRFTTYRIAEPEKALLDWIYLNRQEGLPTPLDEINLQFLDIPKLKAYAERFPGTVNKLVKQFLSDHTIAA
jgi:hypothetical protein